MMQRYGFNFGWMYAWEEGRTSEPADEQALDFMAEYGFNFVRIPTNYHFWTRDFDYFHPDKTVFEVLDSYLAACRARGFQLSLNLHRAPGYCINRNDLERHNLWQDGVAQDAFVYLWETFARRYRGVPSNFLSFDLVNEPPEVGQYEMTRENHAALIKRTVAAIRAVDPQREIVIDGLGAGNLAMPELTDLGVVYSGRGYQPMSVSHYQASWWDGHPGLPEPSYPCTTVRSGTAAPCATITSPGVRWRRRARVFIIGEFGCYNRTPNDVALAWFRDLFAVYKEFGWGYAMWNFKGDFGIIGHDRPGVQYETIRGYKVDRALLELMIENRV